MSGAVRSRSARSSVQTKPVRTASTFAPFGTGRFHRISGRCLEAQLHSLDERVHCVVGVAQLRRGFLLDRYSWKKHGPDLGVREVLSNSVVCLFGAFALRAPECT